MGFFSDFVGHSHTASFGREENIEDLNYSKKEGDLITAPAFQDIEYKRVPRKNLDNTYLTDPQTFGTINRKTNKIMRAGHSYKYELKRDEKLWTGFWERVGNIGQRFDEEELHERMFLDKFKYGVTYLEFIFNDQLTKIIDLKPLDARIVDWARDANNNIVFDLNTQRPLGYSIEVDFDTRGKFEGDPLPQGTSVSLEPNQIFVYSFRIASLPLFTFGNGFEYLGTIEPAYLSKTRKDKIIEAVTNELYIAGSNPIYGVLGDAQRRPSKQQKRKTLEALKNMRHSSATVFEYPTEIKTLDVKHSDQYAEIIKFLKSDQANAIGIPLALMDNTSDIPRSALKMMKEDLDISEQAIISKHVKQFNRQVLKFISTINGWPEVILEWGDVSTEDIDTKVKNVIEMVKNRLIEKDDALGVISQAMNLGDVDVPEEEPFNPMNPQSIPQEESKEKPEEKLKEPTEKDNKTTQK